MLTEFWWNNVEGRDHFEDLVIDGGFYVLKLSLKKYCVYYRLHLAYDNGQCQLFQKVIMKLWVL
jgi:hypothetical protein